MRRVLAVILIVVTGCLAGRMLYGQSQLKRLNDELVQIAGKLTPAVVEIELPAPPGPRIIRQMGGDGDAQWQAVVAMAEGAGAAQPIVGSGVIMTPDGFILTSARHFQGEDEAKPKVKLADGRTFEGKLVGLDRRTGLAVIKIEARDLPAVVLADKTPPVGSLVLAASNAAGLGSSVSLGVVSGTERVVAGEGPAVLGSSTQYGGLVQITNPVGATDAGGLAADLDGKMIGMLHSSLTGRARLAEPVRGQGPPGVHVFGLGLTGPPTVQGVSFVTPAEVIRQVFEPLRRGEKLKWGYLGVYFGVARNEGLRITKLVPDGPAAAAGLKEGDLIRSLTVPGQPTLQLKGDPAEPAVLARMIGWAPPGTEVTLGLTRDARAQEVKVKLGTAPEVPEQQVMVFGPDVKFRVEGNVNIGERTWLGVQLEAAEGGVRVAAVIPGSPAERHGLRVGDVIVRIGDAETPTTEAAAAEVRKHKGGDRVGVTVRRGDAEVVVEVELGRQPALPMDFFRMGAQAEMGVEAKDTEQGLRVMRVFEGSAAEKAGLKTDDIIIRADDKDLAGLGDLREVLNRHRPEDEITVTVRRGGEELDLKVKLETKEPPRPRGLP